MGNSFQLNKKGTATRLIQEVMPTIGRSLGSILSNLGSPVVVVIFKYSSSQLVDTRSEYEEKADECGHESVSLKSELFDRAAIIVLAGKEH